MIINLRRLALKGACDRGMLTAVQALYDLGNTDLEAPADMGTDRLFELHEVSMDQSRCYHTGDPACVGLFVPDRDILVDVPDDKLLLVLARAYYKADSAADIVAEGETNHHITPGGAVDNARDFLVWLEDLSQDYRHLGEMTLDHIGPAVEALIAETGDARSSMFA